MSDITAGSVRFGLSQFPDQVGMRSPGSSGIRTRIKPCGRFQGSVPKKLANRFVAALVGIQMDFCAQVPELMRGDFYPYPPDDRPLNCDSQRRKRPPLTLMGDEQIIWPSADHLRCNFIAKGIEPVRQHLGKLVFKRLLVFDFVLPNHDQRWFASSLWPMQVLIELEGREVFDPKRYVQKNVDGQCRLKIDESATGILEVAPRGPPQQVWQLDQLRQDQRIIELAQQVLVLLGQS